MPVLERFRDYLLSYRWGGHSLAALYVSVLSGVVLAWQYDLSEPYYSSGTLELVTPFGSFWRSCHFYSSQAFFLLLAPAFPGGADQPRPPGQGRGRINRPAGPS